MWKRDYSKPNLQMKTSQRNKNRKIKVNCFSDKFTEPQNHLYEDNIVKEIIKIVWHICFIAFYISLYIYSSLNTCSCQLISICWCVKDCISVTHVSMINEIVSLLNPVVLLHEKSKFIKLMKIYFFKEFKSLRLSSVVLF